MPSLYFSPASYLRPQLAAGPFSFCARSIHTYTNYGPRPPHQKTLLTCLLGLPVQSNAYLVKSDSRLDGALIPHGLETLLPLVELEGLVDDAVHLDLAAVEIVDGGGELVGLGEGAEDGDLVANCRHSMVRT
jgi:hypothetical protein